MIRVLYDGWPLVRQPNSPGGLHLITLLQQQHAEVRAVVALPEQPPAWLPEGVVAQVLPTANSLRARLGWEQRSLPRLAADNQADLLHLTTSHPPIFGARRSVLSPAEFPAQPGEHRTGFDDRLRTAVSSGGMSRLRGLFWPSDLAAQSPQDMSAPIFYLPPEPSLHGSPDAHLDLPETYLLYQGPADYASLRRLLDAWSWAAGSIGDYYPLLLLGLDAVERQHLEQLLPSYNLGGTLRTLPAMLPSDIPALFQGCTAVFHPAPLAIWGGSVRLALRYGKPLVAADGPLADALLGRAAYLAPQDDLRALGAGIITVVVEENMAGELAQAGRERAATWEQSSFKESLYAAYQAVMQSS